MEFQTRLVRSGNSWALVIPKIVRQTSGIRPGIDIMLKIMHGQLLAYPKTARPLDDEYEVARRLAKRAWDEAFELTWRHMVGLEE